VTEQSGRSGGVAGTDVPTGSAVDRLLDDFLHDVRSPLAAIRGAAEIVLRYGADEAVREEFTQAIADEAERMDQTILDVVRRLRATAHGG
jgi:signal transduction histidine kinase